MEMLSGERFSDFLNTSNPKCSPTRLAFKKYCFRSWLAYKCLLCFVACNSLAQIRTIFPSTQPFFILQSKCVGAGGQDIIPWRGHQQARHGVAERLFAPDVDPTLYVLILQVWKWPILPISFNSLRAEWALCSDRHTERCWRTDRWGGRHGSWTLEWIWMEPSGFGRTDRWTLTAEKGLMRMWKWVWCDVRSDGFLGARSSQPERIASHWRCTCCKARFKGVWNLPC